MSQDLPSMISTKILIPQSDAANMYKAHILLTEGRELSKEQAVNELLAIGAHSALPRDVFNTLNLEVPEKVRAAKRAVAA